MIFQNLAKLNKTQKIIIYFLPDRGSPHIGNIYSFFLNYLAYFELLNNGYKVSLVFKYDFTNKLKKNLKLNTRLKKDYLIYITDLKLLLKYLNIPVNFKNILYQEVLISKKFKHGVNNDSQYKKLFLKTIVEYTKTCPKHIPVFIYGKDHIDTFNNYPNILYKSYGNKFNIYIHDFIYINNKKISKRNQKTIPKNNIFLLYQKIKKLKGKYIYEIK